MASELFIKEENRLELGPDFLRDLCGRSLAHFAVKGFDRKI
jgi:hypothetical protein